MWIFPGSLGAGIIKLDLADPTSTVGAGDAAAAAGEELNTLWRGKDLEEEGEE